LYAADIIEERGLAKETLEDEQGRLCAHGALVVALCGDPKCFGIPPRKQGEIRATERIAAERVIRYLRSGRYLHEEINLAEWNDRPERTKREVVRTFRAAAVSARHQRPSQLTLRLAEAAHLAGFDPSL
jgi:hypothetical protein